MNNPATYHKVHRTRFAALQLDSLEWEEQSGSKDRPSYSEAIIDEETINELAGYGVDTNCDISISIRKYPRRYFVAINLLQADEECEITPDDLRDLLIPFDPQVSVIVFRVDHAEFERDFGDYMAKVYDFITTRDLDAIYINTVVKAWKQDSRI